MFQSTLPRGGDIASIGDISPGIVSIHAPAWGATDLKPAITQALLFQSTLPRGDDVLACGRQPIPIFNLAPAGEDFH